MPSQPICSLNNSNKCLNDRAVAWAIAINVQSSAKTTSERAHCSPSAWFAQMRLHSQYGSHCFGAVSSSEEYNKILTKVCFSTFGVVPVRGYILFGYDESTDSKSNGCLIKLLLRSNSAVVFCKDLLFLSLPSALRFSFITFRKVLSKEVSLLYIRTQIIRITMAEQEKSSIKFNSRTRCGSHEWNSLSQSSFFPTRWRSKLIEGRGHNVQPTINQTQVLSFSVLICFLHFSLQFKSL